MVTCKLVFISTLATVFFTFFGLPSYEKYQKNQTFISEKKVKFDLTKPPALTFFTSRSSFFKGWKENLDEKWNNLENVCNTSEDFMHVVKCINEKTFKLTDIVENATSGDKTKKDIKDSKFWTEGLNVFQAGKSFSLNNSYRISADSPYLEIHLKKNQTHFVFIHDPDYFLHTANPDAMPHILLGMDDRKSSFVYMRAIYQRIMDKPGQRCESSESYIFTACITNSISRMIGCRLEWDDWSSQDIPRCSRVAELLRFEQEYLKLYGLSKETIVDYTGCLPPCRYTEYRLATEPVKYEVGNFILQIVLTSLDVIERTEELIYPMESFVSEFGGALGLFLGFSFMMVWDMLEFLMRLHRPST